jgi:hypothetical protein
MKIKMQRRDLAMADTRRYGTRGDFGKRGNKNQLSWGNHGYDAQ